MLARAVLTLFPFIAASVDFGERALGMYNYDRCDATMGPSAWPSTCAAHVLGGTPIDLCGAVAFPGSAPVINATGYSSDIPMNISIGGASVTVTVTGNRPYLTAGNLAFLVGRSDVNENATWELQQMHMHWGRSMKTNEGSEHYLQGSSFAGEAHLVHYNKKYGTFAAAAASGSKDALLVVGVFLEYSGNPGTDVNAISAITTALNTGTVSATPSPIGNLNFADIFAITGTQLFYSYGGGLTTPNCNEIVTWIVMQIPVPISGTTLRKLWSLPKDEGDAETVGTYGNFRPLQELMGRTVYQSMGISAACTTVTEPNFECRTAPVRNGAPGTLPSVVLPLALVLITISKLV